MFWAALGGHHALMQLFLDIGMDVCAKDTSGRRASHWAREGVHGELARILNSREMDGCSCGADNTHVNY